MQTIEKQLKYNERILEQSLKEKTLKEDLSDQSPPHKPRDDRNGRRSPNKGHSMKENNQSRRQDEIMENRIKEDRNHHHSRTKKREPALSSTRNTHRPTRNHRSDERNEWIHAVLEDGDLSDISQLLETIDPQLVQVHIDFFPFTHLCI